MTKTIISAIIIAPALLLGHGGVDHSKTVTKHITPSEKKAKVFSKINKQYQVSVKPIFQAKCFSCHADKPKNMPWYYSLPGAKQLIDYDMNEAKQHIDMRKDFPFVSHGTPSMDLKSILESVTEAEMPPLQYRLLHWDSTLNKGEVDKVDQWAASSLKLLNTLK